MIRFMIHAPVNARGYITRYIKEHRQNLETVLEDTIKITSPHDAEYYDEEPERWLSRAVENDIVPDITFVNSPELADFVKDKKVSDVFEPFSPAYQKKHEVRDEMNALIDPNGILKPVSVTPLIMIYNKDLVRDEDLTHSWADIFNPAFNVIFPHRTKPLVRAAGGWLLHTYKDRFMQFDTEAVYRGSPSDVVRAVASGEYHLGMTLYPFAQAAPHATVGLNYPTEGLIPMLQTVMLKKGVDPRALYLVDMLLSSDIQCFLSTQGTWVVHTECQHGDDFTYRQLLKTFSGWDSHLQQVQAFDRLQGYAYASK